ncbi:MAG: hypothetical protein JWN02_2363, partial [Acidobacteria bacterium]|nr:hypothetical protein [Acidobacteriota bacterium]
LLPVQVSTRDGANVATVSLNWTVAAPAGAQVVTVVFDPANAITEDDETNNRGRYALVVSTADPVAKLAATLTADPTYAEANTTVSVDALVQNIGNVPLSSVVLTFTATAAGATPITGAATLASLARNDFVQLHLGAFTPAADGTWVITLAASDPSITMVADPKSVTIGPFASATAITATPARVPVSLPLVRCQTHVSRTNTIAQPVDPLIAIVVASLNKGLSWQAPVLRATINADRSCYKCHVQSQGMVSFELSRAVAGANVDPSTEQYLYDETLSHEANGYTNAGSHTAFTVAAWSLSFWHDTAAAQPHLLSATDRLLTWQNADGSFDCDRCEASMNNREAMTMMAMTAIARSWQLTHDARYQDALARSANWAIAVDLQAEAHTWGAEAAARIGIGLSYATPNLTDERLAAAAQARLEAVKSYLQSIQNTDGTFQTLGVVTPDRPVVRTAQGLYALALAGVPGSDPKFRAGLLWLINAQEQNGGWRESNGEDISTIERWIDESTWAMIAMPTAFQRLGRFDVDLQVTLPPGARLVSAATEPAATTTGADGTNVRWHLPDLSDTGTDIVFNVDLGSIADGEARAVASAATVSYKHPFTGAAESRSVTIPSVTGYAPLAVQLSTDHSSYGASANVTVTEAIANLGATPDGVTNTVSVRDANGTTVATLAAGEALPAASRPFAGWHFAAPMTGTAPEDSSLHVVYTTVDFHQLLGALGSGATFDTNSIRVSSDLAPAVELPYSFTTDGVHPDSGMLRVVLPSSTAPSSPFALHVFFDTIDHGFKPPSLYNGMAKGETGGLLARYWSIDTATSTPWLSDPSGIVRDRLLASGIQPVLTLPYNSLTNGDYWTLEWSGALLVPESGTYQMRMGSDDGSWAYIDGQLLFSLPGIHTYAEATTSINLTAGLHSIRLVMFDWTGGTNFFFVWARPGRGFEDITAPYLLPTAGTSTVGAPALLPEAAVSRTYVWNTGASAAGGYSVSAALRNGAAIITGASTPFTITPSSQVTATIATDKASYEAATTVHVTGAAQYAAGNSTLTNLTATLSIAGGSGGPLATRSVPIATLVGGSIVPLSLDWPVASSGPGTYTATIVVTNAAGATLVQSSVPFSLRPSSQSGAGVTGTFTVPPSAAHGSTVT